MMCNRVGHLLLGIALSGVPLLARADDLPPPLEPAAGLASLHVPAGYRVEQVAAEPLVTSPVALDWGPDGRLWVAEMIDYPLGLDNQGQPGGRICYLEDTDGDGRYDRRASFLDGVAFPNGVMAWRDGVLVTAAGELFFARDTDGDGKADERKTLFDGFKPGNQQHRVNGPRWGMDGWCYLANGDSGGVIQSRQTGATVDISGRDLRVRPDDGALETVTGMTQFGRTCDDWGHWFGSNNSNPGYQFVLEDRYLRRNPHVAPPAPKVTVVDQNLQLNPLSVTVKRFNDPHAANHYTSACGGTIYRDDLLGADVAGNYFVCEPSHNLVHRESLSRTGLVFHGEPADGTEAHFLRSTDNWFRPVMCRPGPDGALWVVDMYRGILEHPEYIPDDIEAGLDLRAGADRGRIYRVVRSDTPLRKVPRCADLTAPQLAAALDSPSGTQRDLVERVILWRGDRGLAPPLAALARSAARPVVRAQALWTLDGLGLVTEEMLLAALADREGAVRAQALEIAQPHLAAMPKLGSAIAAMAADNKAANADVANRDADVQLRLAYLMGDWSDARAGSLLGKLMVRHAADPYLTAAALSSVNRENVPAALAEALAAEAPDPHAVGQLLSIAAAVGSQKAIAEGLAAAATPKEGRFAPWQFAAIAAALDQWRHQGRPLAKILGPDAVAELNRVGTAARTTAADDSLDERDRAAAIAVLGLSDDRPQDLAVLTALLEPQQSAAIQNAAIEALARSGDNGVAEALLVHWPSYSPAIVAHAIDVLLSRDAWIATLLDRMDDGTIPPSGLDAARRGQLLAHRSPELRERAAKLLAAGNADRQKVIDQFAWVLDKAGDPARGRQVFLKRCAACHRLEGQGFSVGADLAAVGNKSPQAQLVSILDPNRAIEDRYVNYLATTDDGRQFSGVLVAESGESLTLRGQEGKEQVLLRKNLDTLHRTGKSLMPEGLERDMTGDDLADVIAYVASAGPQSPAVARPAADGSLTLTAADARVEGPTIHLEEKYKNLGFWQSADDVAIWSIELPAAGSFKVELDYACDNAAAGNAFLLAVGSQELTGQVGGTGTWDTYRAAAIGRVELPAGARVLTFRSAGPPNGALMDLRSIRLVPASK